MDHVVSIHKLQIIFLSFLSVPFDNEKDVTSLDTDVIFCDVKANSASSERRLSSTMEKQHLSVLLFVSSLILLATLDQTYGQPTENVVLRAVTIEQPPFVFVKEGDFTGNNRFKGMIIDIFDAVLKRLNRNITYELYLVPDGQFGEKNSSGLWTGIVGELTSGNADIALAPLTITSRRIADIDFTASYFDTGLEILVKKPDSTRDILGFLDPFEADLWILLAATSVIMSIIIWVIDGFSPFGFRRSENEDEKGELSMTFDANRV